MKLIIPILLLCLSANAQQKFTVYFDTGVAEITAASAKKLQQWIAENPDIAIETIDGYTDKTGNAGFNLELSQRRAATVGALLKSADVNLDYAMKHGFGEQQATGYNNADDRKVEILYVKAEYSKPKDPQPDETEFTQQLKNGKVGDIILLKNLLFYGGATYVLPESRPVLKELLDVMLSHPKLKIDIQGHICCDIDDIGNLSGRRADEIFLYLTNNGIDKNRVTTRGYGGHRPIYSIPEKSDEQRYANRRVEIEILAK